MALKKIPVAIPFLKGVQTKVDDKQTQLGNVKLVENATFETTGKYKKRTGYDQVNKDILNEISIYDPQRITSFNDELCVINPNNFYSYSEAIQKWTNKGTISNIFPNSKPVIRNSYNQRHPVCQTANNMELYAWEDTRGGIRCTLIDNTTKTEIISDFEISSTGVEPLICKRGSFFYIFFSQSSTLVYRKLNSVNPNSFTANTTVTSIQTGTEVFDIIEIRNRILCAYRSTSSTLRFIYILEDDSLTAPIEEASVDPSIKLDLVANSLDQIQITINDTNDISFLLKNFFLTFNIIPPTLIASDSNVGNITSITSDNTNYTIYYERIFSTSYNNLIRKNTINLNATIGTPSDFIRSCMLLSKAFTYDENTYLPVLYQSTLQSTIFVLNNSAEVVCKIAAGVAGVNPLISHLPKVPQLSTFSFLLPHQIKSKIVSENNKFFSVLGINKTTLNFNNINKFESISLGENLHVAGGMLQIYDGKQVVEQGFHFFPEALAQASTTDTGGGLTDGTRQYIAVYVWTDNKGLEHKSAPSLPFTSTISSGSSTQTTTIRVPTLRVTEKNNVYIDLYRTENLGTVFYKVTSILNRTFNTKTADTVSIVDGISDANLISNELLYTTSGELENIAPPAAFLIADFQNRIMLAGLEDENLIQYSKIRQEGKPVEFNDTLTIPVNPLGGAITAIATMQDKFIIFKNNAIFALMGEGPNNLGEQDNFSPIELISADVGCINQNSVVLIPKGLLFQSNKGIYLLDKSLNTSYIGDAVEAYNDLEVKSVTYIPTKNLVIFLTAQESLVYDYYNEQWSIYTNHSGISSTFLNNFYYYIRSDNNIFKSASHYTDNGSAILLKVVTDWLNFAGVQGYQRVYRALILGEFKSPHKLTIEAAYDFNESFKESKTIDSSDNYTQSIYGETATYGSESPYGGGNVNYQIRLDFVKQKCESIKLRISESQENNFGEGLELSNLLLLIGLKQTEFKLQQSKVYGTSKNT